MKNDLDKTNLQVIGLGIISGMRATAAPAIVAHYLSKKNSSSLKKSKLGFIQSPVTAVLTKLFTAGELIVDKLPSTGNRIATSGLISRTISGAFVGAAVSAANKDNVVKGILIGGASALAATYATFFLRQYIDKNTSLKDPVTGALEDAVAIGAGVLLMR